MRRARIDLARHSPVEPRTRADHVDVDIDDIDTLASELGCAADRRRTGTRRPPGTARARGAGIRDYELIDDHDHNNDHDDTDDGLCARRLHPLKRNPRK